MKNLFLLICLSAMFFVLGCSSSITISKPSEKERMSANFGDPPTNIKTDLQSYFDDNLKDSKTVRVKSLTEAEKGIIYIPNGTGWKGDSRYIDIEYQPSFGWLSCAIYNAKNSYGSYTGFKKLVLFYELGKESPHFIDSYLVGFIPSGIVGKGYNFPYLEQQGCI